MVGIGAAIARQDQGYNICLGDIVVSQPDGQSGGADHFERKGILNMPPEALLKALAKLQARHEIKSSKVPKFLAKMVEQNPQMAKAKSGKASYMHKGEENDRLFKATYPHVDDFYCRNWDPDQGIQQYNCDSTVPEIHYSVIASGNRLVKDAAIRDSILQNTAKECICLEMEATGLMNSFPFLVIRGICDYADSHKDDQWQRYAAATAAAYTKEFLGAVPGDDLERARKAADISKTVSQPQKYCKSSY